MADRQTEVEATLVVVSSMPGEFGDRIAALRSLAGYRLIERPEFVLHDVYWDLPDGDLGAERLALRLRFTDRERLVTLKGRGHRSQGASVERLEIEDSWSARALSRVLKGLDSLGITLDTPNGSACMENPEETLRNLGFRIVQERETRRRPRDVAPANVPDPVAELVVDTTIYWHRTVVRHHEVEIEAREECTASVLASLVDALLNHFPSELRVWHHSKLATGKAIVGLLDARLLNQYLSEKGDIEPAGYEMIEDYLSQQKKDQPDAP